MTSSARFLSIFLPFLVLSLMSFPIVESSFHDSLMLANPSSYFEKRRHASKTKKRRMVNINKTDKEKKFKRRKKNEKNPWVLCGCRCGKKLHKYDSQRRERKFIRGHSYIRTKKIKEKDSQLKIRRYSDLTILAITAYRNYEKTDMTKNEIFDALSRDLSLTKKQRKNLSHRLRGYFEDHPKEKKRKTQIVWNKGKKGLYHPTPETIEQILESREWYKGSEEAKAMGRKVSESKKGIPMPKDQKRKINEKNKKKNEKELKKNRVLLKKLVNDEVINGLLLSDAHLRRVKKNQNSYFAVTQTLGSTHTKSRIKFLYEIQKYLKSKYNIPTRMDPPYFKKSSKSWQTKIETPRHVVWTAMRKMWYIWIEDENNEKKIIPEWLKLTPKTLAYCYMGDGSSSPKGGKSVEKYDVLISTNDFKKQYVEQIIKKLKSMGVDSYPQKRRLKKPAKGRGFAIAITDVENVEKFMKLVERFMIKPIFNYKIKHPLKMTSEIIAQRAKKRKSTHSEKTILAITAYKNYEKTDLTRSQIFDYVAADLGLNKKERNQLGGRLRNYLINSPYEKNRKRLKEKIIETYKLYEKSDLEPSEIYDKMQKKLNIPAKNRHAMRNVIYEYPKQKRNLNRS